MHGNKTTMRSDIRSINPSNHFTSQGEDSNPLKSRQSRHGSDITFGKIVIIKYNIIMYINKFVAKFNVKVKIFILVLHNTVAFYYKLV